MIECEAQSVGRQRDSSLYERMTSRSKRDRDNAITRDTGLDSESLQYLLKKSSVVCIPEMQRRQRKRSLEVDR